MNVTILDNCALCGKHGPVYGWGLDYYCNGCASKVAEAMSNPHDAPKVEPQDCAMCGGYDLRCPRCKGGRSE